MNINTKNSYLVICLIFVGLALTSITNAAEDKHKNDIITGTLICLVPDYEAGNVKPVIANENCSGHAPHGHVILDTREKVGNVYAVKGSPEALKRLQSLNNKVNIKIAGKISGNQDAWVITVN